MFGKSNKLSVMGLLLVVVMLVAACAPKPTEAPTAEPTEAPAAGKLECPIVVGAAVHMTGGTAIYDMPPIEGARLAIKEINEAGGVLGCEIQMLELDGKSDPAKVGDAAVVAVEQGAQVLIAPCDFDYGSPVSIVAQENGLVGISECASSPLYNSIVLGDKQFTMSPWANVQGAVSGEHACKEMGWKRGAVIVDTFSDYTRTLAEYWSAAYEHAGCEVLKTVNYLKGDMTFAAQTEELLNLDPSPDVVMLSADSPDNGLIVREIRAAGIDAAIVGGDALDTGEFFGAIGAEAGNDIFPTTFFWLGEESGEDMVHFLEAFEQEYGKEADSSLYLMGYNLIYMLKQAIEKAGTVEGAALAQAMENTVFDITGGTIEWSDAASGHVPTAPLAIVEVQKAEPSFWGMFKPSWVPPVESGEEEEAPAASELECPIVVGAAVHMTGGTAIYDMPPIEGARLAIKEINEAGGVLGCEIQMLELDGKSDPAKVGDAAVVAVEQGAQVLIAPCDFDYGSPVSIVAQENGLVGISECASSPLYNSIVLGDKQFTMSPWANVQGAVSGEHACKEMGWKRGAVIVDTFSDYTRTLAEYWSAAYEHAGCEVLKTVNYLKGDMTFAAQTEELLNLDPSPDVVMLSADSPDNGLIVREIRAAGIDAAIVGGDALDTGEFFGAIGAEAGNDIFPTTFFWLGEESGEDMVHFLEAFEQEYGKEADSSLYLMGYNLIYMLKQAIEKAGTVEGAALAQAMENTVFDITGGTIEWSDAASGHVPTAPLAIVEVQKAEPSFWGMFKPSWVPPVE